MAERESSLLSELGEREALAYSQGRVYTHGSTAIRPAEVFLGDGAGAWVDRLATELLSQAFPALPFQSERFPETLTAEMMGAIFRGLFQGEPDAAAAVAAFGPALGLTRPEAPTRFDASVCRVLDVMARELESRGGEVPSQDLLWSMCRYHGLNRALAMLYLAAFVRRERAGLELIPEHSVQQTAGGPFQSDRVTWDLVPELAYAASLAGQLGVLRAKPSLAWNAILPYANLLVEGLGPAGDETQAAEQERRLLEALENLARRVEQARTQLVELSAGLDEEAEDVLALLQRLQVLSAVGGYRGFHDVAVDGFGGVSGLGQALDLYGRVERLQTLAPAIAGAKRYLGEMTFGAEHQELALRRDSAAARIGLDSLIANPDLWTSVEEGYRRLRQEYANTYLAHHSRYHEEAAELVNRLERLRSQVEALDRFNEVPELGGPVGADVPGRFRELLAGLKSCALTEEEIPLEEAPECHACRLALGDNVPGRQAAAVFGDAERAMRDYNRRLASEGVRRVLAHPTREQLDKFVSLVQVADPTPLADVLDDDVLEFLRSFVHRR